MLVLFIRYIGILTMTICCDGILRIKKNGMSQKNFRNCKMVTSPAELKSGRCAKSCFNHWKWLQMKLRKHMDMPLPDFWIVPKRTFELFLQRLERLVQPNHRLHQKVRRAEYCENLEGWLHYTKLQLKSKLNRSYKSTSSLTISLCCACWFSSSTAITLWFNLAICRRIICTWNGDLGSS